MGRLMEGRRERRDQGNLVQVLGGQDAYDDRVRALMAERGTSGKDAYRAAAAEVLTEARVQREHEAKINGGATEEEARAAAEAMRTNEPDYRGRIARRRNKKEGQSDAERAKAEASIAQNTELFQGLHEDAMEPQETALANLAADPMLVAAQQRVFDRYGEMSNDGWTNLDRQALDQQAMQSRREEQSQRDSVLAAAARRGDTSGGNTLLASLMAQQGGANRESQRSTELAMTGRDRALQALASGGQLAGQMRDQGVGEQVARGSAMDQMRQWAAGNRLATAGGLANATLGQAQYQLGRADDLAPWTPGQLIERTLQGGQAALETYNQFSSAGGGDSGGGGNKSAGGGGAARTRAAATPGPSAGLPQVPAQLPGGATSPNPTFARSQTPRRPSYMR